MNQCGLTRPQWMRFAPKGAATVPRMTVAAFHRLAMVCALAGALAGCAAVATHVMLSAGPELLASAMRPYSFRSEFADAGALIKARDWLGLSTLARQQLVRQPERGEWWQVAGYGHMQLGEFETARDCFARVTRLLPEEVGGWNLYAFTLARTGDNRGALAALDRATQTDPTSTVAWVLQGDLLAEAGRAREALRAYDRALEIDPRDIFAWYGQGRLARSNRDAAAMERAIKALKQLHPPFAAELEKTEPQAGDGLNLKR